MMAKFYDSWFCVHFHAHFPLYLEPVCYCWFFVYTFSQIDTTDILFICGGAFIDIEKTISERLYQYRNYNICVHTFNMQLVFLPKCQFKVSWMHFRRQDSSIGFGAPVRANMRASGVTNAVVASSLMETVSALKHPRWLLSISSLDITF